MADKPSLANGLQLQGCLVPISMTRSVQKLLWLMSILNNCRTCIAEFSRAHAAFNAQCTMAHQTVPGTAGMFDMFSSVRSDGTTREIKNEAPERPEAENLLSYSYHQGKTPLLFL